MNSVEVPKETFIVPYQKNDQFTGRVAFLDTLAAKLWKNNSPQFSHRIVLYGLGGVGKTQIALQYAHTHRDRYGNIFWVSAVNETSLLASFQDIGKRTGCVANIETLEPSEIATRVLSWLNMQERWLMVFDNLEDDSIIEKYLPYSSPLKHMVITTRDRHFDISAEGIEVDVLPVDDAIEFLLTRSKTVDTDASREEAKGIVKLLGCLPLAIEQAAAYIRQVLAQNIFKFAQRYKDVKIRLDKKPQKGIRDYKDSVATTWSMSFKLIENINRDASTLLRIMAFLDPDGIPIEFLEAGKNGVNEEFRQFLPDSERFDRALADLERFSLIKRKGIEKKSMVVIHRLVQDVVLDHMVPEIRSDMINAVITLSALAFPNWNTLQTIDNETRLKCREYQDQVLVLLSKVPLNDSTVLGSTTYRMGRFFLDEGKYKHGMDLMMKALHSFEKAETRDIRSIIRIKGHIGWVPYFLEQYEQSIGILEPHLRIAEKLLGEEDLDTLEIIENLAMSFQGEGRVEHAIDLQEKVLNVRRKVLGIKDADTLTAMHNLAGYFHSQNRFTDAMRLGEEVLQGRILLLGEDHPNTLSTMSDLGVYYGELGEVEDQLRLAERVLEASMRILGADHNETLITMYNLAIACYRYGGKSHQTLQLAQQSFEGSRRILGADHPTTKTCEALFKQLEVRWLGLS